jgi:hypothetical protein
MILRERRSSEPATSMHFIDTDDAQPSLIIPAMASYKSGN